MPGSELTSSSGAPVDEAQAVRRDRAQQEPLPDIEGLTQAIRDSFKGLSRTDQAGLLLQLAPEVEPDFMAAAVLAKLGDLSAPPVRAGEERKFMAALAVFNVAVASAHRARQQRPRGGGAADEHVRAPGDAALCRALVVAVQEA